MCKSLKIIIYYASLRENKTVFAAENNAGEYFPQEEEQFKRGVTRAQKLISVQQRTQIIINRRNQYISMYIN